jgi:tRNA pseudouridine38-40 synthase
MTRVRLDLAYDGTGFAGWARQRSGLRTVQQVLEEALTAVLRMAEPAQLTVAGRTDAGVHASGQVAHFDLPDGMWAAHEEKLLRRLAGKLPMDVRVFKASTAPEGFDARFAATSRRYIYRVCDSKVGTLPTRRGFVLWHNRMLDLDRLNEASRLLLGEHDFAAYCKRREGATTIRRLLDVHWERTRHDEVEATVEADAFCHSMVRALVAALLMAGDGRCAPDFPAEVLASKERHPSVNVLPPHGLTLEEVRYPSDAELAARVAETRKIRVLGC